MSKPTEVRQCEYCGQDYDMQNMYEENHEDSDASFNEPCSTCNNNSTDENIYPCNVCYHK